MNSEISRSEPRRAPRTAVAVLIGSLLIPVACGGDPSGGEPTTTPPTTITVPTTIPEISTTSTTVPEPSTTTTTVPETTTTTLPADICEATGQASIDGKNIELGLFREGYIFEDDQEGITGRLIRLYEKPYDDYAEESANVLFADICVGKYADGSPIIVPIKLDRPNIDTMNTRWYSNSDLITSDKRGDQFYPIEDLRTELETRLENHSQIGFVILNIDTSPLPNDFNFDEWLQGCVADYGVNFDENDFNFVAKCQSFFESYKLLPNNVDLINLLKSGSLNSLTEIKPISVFEILLFKPSIPNP